MLSKLGRVDNHCPHYPTFGSFPMSPQILHFICLMCSSSGDHVFKNWPLNYIYIANSLQPSNRKLLLAHIKHVEDETLGASVALPKQWPHSHLWWASPATCTVLFFVYQLANLLMCTHDLQSWCCCPLRLALVVLIIIQYIWLRHKAPGKYASWVFGLLFSFCNSGVLSQGGETVQMMTYSQAATPGERQEMWQSEGLAVCVAITSVNGSNWVNHTSQEQTSGIPNVSVQTKTFISGNWHLQNRDGRFYIQNSGNIGGNKCS